MYRDVDMSDLPSQYTEDIENKIFRQFLNIPDPRYSMPVSSASVMGLNAVTQKQELWFKGPSTFLRANPSLKEALVVVDQFTPGYQFTPTLNFLEDL